MKLEAIVSVGVALSVGGVVQAKISPEELAKKQCRSVHLQYGQLKNADWAYVEVTPTKSAPGTYFCALGFAKGYFGMQELANGKKVIIFSVWEPNHGQVAKNVPEEKRAKMLEKGEGVRVMRFGNEGTGGKSFFDYDWQLGETIKFAVNAKPIGKEATVFTGYFYNNKTKTWQKMTKFRTITKGIRLRGGYSFVEDFRRNYKSAGIARVAGFGNGWFLPNAGSWTSMTEARFTADPTPSKNVDAGAKGAGFFLATGGETKMETTKLWGRMNRKALEGAKPPAELLELVKQHKQ